MIASKKKPLTGPEMAALASQPQIGLGAPPPAPAPAPAAAEAPQADNQTDGLRDALAAGALDTEQPAQGGKGILGKISDYLKQPGVSAALFRSAGATLNGGIGAGIQTAGAYMDGRRAQDAAAGAAAADYRLKERGLANQELGTRQTGEYQDGRLALDANGQLIQKYGIDTTAATSRYTTDAGVGNNIRTTDAAMANAALAANTSLTTNANTVGATYAGQAQSDVNSRRALQATMFARQPKGVTTATKYKNLPVVTSEDVYNGLADGAPYMDAGGQVRFKTP